MVEFIRRQVNMSIYILIEERRLYILGLALCFWVGTYQYFWYYIDL